MNQVLFQLQKKKTHICAIINVTPDSFSDGNQWFQPEKAIQHALNLSAQGADLLDIGAESTRPSSRQISADQEIERLSPVIKGIQNKIDIPLSIDTWKADIASYCVNSGVQMINDITGLFGDPNMADVIAHSQVGYVLMFNPIIARPDHKSSKNFSNFKLYKNKNSRFKPHEYELMHKMPIFDLMTYYFEKALTIAVKAGISEKQIFLDPGIGFALTKKENLLLIKNLQVLKALGFPVFLGASRKRFIVNILKNANIPVDPQTDIGFYNRDAASAALTTYAASKGIEIVRTHTVKEHLIAARIGESIYHAEQAQDQELAKYTRHKEELRDRLL